MCELTKKLEALRTECARLEHLRDHWQELAITERRMQNRRDAWQKCRWWSSEIAAIDRQLARIEAELERPDQNALCPVRLEGRIVAWTATKGWQRFLEGLLRWRAARSKRACWPISRKCP